MQANVVGDPKEAREEIQSRVDPSNYNLHNEVWSKCKMPFCVSRRNFVIEIVLFTCQLRDSICSENGILFCVVLTQILGSFQILLFLKSIYRS